MSHSHKDEQSLLPCPFCGSEVDPEGWSSIDRRGPACTNGDCNAAADSAEAWNRRVPDQGLIGALRDIAFLRPAGATPRMVKGELIERIERIAINALDRTTGGQS